VEWLKGQEWDGNVRELENLMGRRVILYSDGVLRPPDEGMESAILPAYHREKRRITDEFERSYLETALRLARGSLGDVSRRTGLSPRQLYSLMRKHGLRKEEFFV